MSLILGGQLSVLQLAVDIEVQVELFSMPSERSMGPPLNLATLGSPFREPWKRLLWLELPDLVFLPPQACLVVQRAERIIILWSILNHWHTPVAQRPGRLTLLPGRSPPFFLLSLNPVF